MKRIETRTATNPFHPDPSQRRHEWTAEHVYCDACGEHLQSGWVEIDGKQYGRGCARAKKKAMELTASSKADPRDVLILGVLGGAYRGGQLERATRTHAIYRDADKAFCGYASSGLVDEYGAVATDVVPSCPKCRKSFESKLVRGIIKAVR